MFKKNKNKTCFFFLLAGIALLLLNKFNGVDICIDYGAENKQFFLNVLHSSNAIQAISAFTNLTECNFFFF